MSVIDILFRLDDISKKYDKYDIDKQRALNANSDDAFARLFNSFEDQIEAALHKSEMAAMEQNRAKLVAMNAEIRRVKARLIEEVPKLQKLSQKRVKGLTKEDLQDRADLVLALPDRIRAIPDGTTSNNKASGASTSKGHVKFDSSDENFGDGFFEQSEESSQFREEYEMRKLKQDEGLDIISDGLDTLKNLAHDMNEELDRQVPLVDEIDTKVDKASSEIRNTNLRLKKTITQIRSSRNICIDIVLTCVLLGIISYLYKYVTIFEYNFTVPNKSVTNTTLDNLHQKLYTWNGSGNSVQCPEWSKKWCGCTDDSCSWMFQLGLLRNNYKYSKANREPSLILNDELNMFDSQVI